MYYVAYGGYMRSHIVLLPYLRHVLWRIHTYCGVVLRSTYVALSAVVYRYVFTVT